MLLSGMAARLPGGLAARLEEVWGGYAWRLDVVLLLAKSRWGGDC